MLKKIFIPFLYACFVIVLRGAEREVFDQANILYDAHDFSGAIEAYKSINDKGYAIWYNIGNAYFELEDYTQALVSWKRAERQASTINELKMIKHNLQQVYSKLKMNYTNNSIYVLLQYLYVIFSPLAIQILFILMTCLLLFFAKTIVYKKHFGLFALLGFCWVLLSILVLVHYGQQSLHGYVVTEAAQLRNRPDIKQQVILELKRGSEITIQQTMIDWYKVKYNNNVGWIAARDVEVV